MNCSAASLRWVLVGWVLFLGGAIASAAAADDPPPNDLFANRAVIQGTSATVTGTLVGATAETGDPVVQGSATVWWTWTAPASGTATIMVTGEGFTPALGLFTGPALPALQVVTANGVPGVTGRAFRAEAGTAYHFVVHNPGSLVRAPLTLSLEFGVGPPNDMFAEAIVLTGRTATSSSTIVNATIETGEPRLGYISTGPTVWWRWTAPATGRALVSADSPFVNVLEAFTGTTLTLLTSIISRNSPTTGGGTPVLVSAGPSRIAFDASVGTTYQFAVGNFYGNSVGNDAISLHLELVDPPANDRFAARIAIPSAPATIDASNFGASTEPNELVIGRPTANSSVWWTWTAPASGRAAIDTTGSGIVPMVAVFTGGDLATLSVVAEHNTATSGTQILTFNTIAGTAYQIRLDGHFGAMGDLRFAFTFAVPPPNDNFANRALLSGSPVQITGRNDGASAESGEPIINYQGAESTVWWTWTAPASGLVSIDTAGTDFNPVLAVFTGSSLGSLVPVTFQSYVTNNVDTVRLTFPATAGTTYQIAVDGELGAIGSVAFQLGVYSPPANDAFADRTMLTGAAVAAQGTSLGASRETGEPGHGFHPTVASVWWTWTAPANARMIATTHGSTFDTILAAYTGDAVNALASVAYNDNAPGGGATSAFAFDAVAGTTYQFAVDGHVGAMGAIAFDLRVAGPPAVGVDAPATSVAAGEALTLTASANGLGPYTYQWTRDGVDVAGAANATLSLPSMQDFLSGQYAVRVTNDYGSTTSAAVGVAASIPPDSGARLTNLSTRAFDLTGDNVMIPGFVVQGPGNKWLLVRAVGPTLAAPPFGLAGTLPNPRMALKKWNGSSYDDVTTNDDWGTNANVAALLTRSGELGAFSLVDGSADAALLVELEPGQYSVIADDPAQQTGIAIVELYDADPAGAGSTSRLINISNRGYVGAGDTIMIPGFVVSNEGPKTLLIRVIGPTLADPPHNVPGVLADPTLAIYRRDLVDNTDELILTNDDWSVGSGAQRTRDVAAQVLAFALPEGSKDAAFVVTLNPGVYTVHARGANDTAGVALVEVYAVP